MAILHRIKITYVTKGGKTYSDQLMSSSETDAKVRIMAMYNDIDRIVETKRLS